jgi:hypothetical protein
MESTQEKLIGDVHEIQDSRISRNDRLDSRLLSLVEFLMAFNEPLPEFHFNIYLLRCLSLSSSPHAKLSLNER